MDGKASANFYFSPQPEEQGELSEKFSYTFFLLLFLCGAGVWSAEIYKLAAVEALEVETREKRNNYLRDQCERDNKKEQEKS